MANLMLIAAIIAAPRAGEKQPLMQKKHGKIGVRNGLVLALTLLLAAVQTFAAGAPSSPTVSPSDRFEAESQSV